MPAVIFRYYLGRAGLKITQKSYGEKHLLLQYNALSYSLFWLPYSFEGIPQAFLHCWDELSDKCSGSPWLETFSASCRVVTREKSNVTEYLFSHLRGCNHCFIFFIEKWGARCCVTLVYSRRLLIDASSSCQTLEGILQVKWINAIRTVYFKKIN